MCAVVRNARAERDTLTEGVQLERSNRFAPAVHTKGTFMNRLIYIIGAVVVVIALLSFFGLR
jgi:ATP/ADP translocase